MKTNLKLSFRSFALAAMFLLAILAGVGPLALAQESVKGTMTLPVAARLGNTMLPPGEYKFSVALIGLTHSILDVEAVPVRVAVFVSSTSKGGAVASAIAEASRLQPSGPQPVNLLTDGDAMMIHSLALSDFGIVVQFFGAAKTSTLHAQSTPTSTTVISAKATN
jgi:hypothetical protein